jgi:CRISPR-associated endonuclease/helicase Cas3
LTWHALDVATILEEGLKRKPPLIEQCAKLLEMSPSDTKTMVLSLVALHDLGKVIASFQALVPEAMKAVGHATRPTLPYRRRTHGHDIAGWALLSALRDAQLNGELAGILPPDCLAPRSERAFATVVSAFTGHHGHPSADKDWNDFQAFAESARDLAAAAELVRCVVSHYAWNKGFPTAAAARRASYFLNGLMILCDWLGSSDRFALISDDMRPADYVEIYARKTAKELLNEVRPALFASPTASPVTPFVKLFAELWGGKKPTPYPMQLTCQHVFENDLTGDGPLLVIIEDMTGAGKTEAADYVAHRLIATGRASGLFVGLPTMTTADQAFRRRAELIDKLWRQPVDRVLIHSRARRVTSELTKRRGLLKTEGFGSLPLGSFISTAERGGVEAGEADCIDWFARSSKRALLAQAGVGTVDQSLLAGLRANYSALRLSGLWHKVLVVDEVHAYDSYMLEVLEKVLQAQAMHGGSAVLMSATLPSRERAGLAKAFLQGLGKGTNNTDILDQLAFPALTIVHGGAPPKLHNVATAPGPGSLERHFAQVHSSEAAANAILSHAAAGRSVVWFRNTVDDAREGYEQVLVGARGRSLPEPLLWHARFLRHDRDQIEANILRSAAKDAKPEHRRGQIVIATQVGEQSLDLDFDALVSDLAPIDALIQRIGRSRRHRRDSTGLLKADGEDERPNLPIVLVAPELCEVQTHWYRQLFPRASRVYRDDARLWLTLNHLLNTETIPRRRCSGPIVLDDDLKALIESVYAEDVDVAARVPAPLRPTLDAAAGEAIEFRRAGQRNRLSFSEGLLADCTSDALVIDEDDAFISAPTRLGENYTLLLAFSDEGEVKLAGGSDKSDPIAASEIRTRWHLTQPEGDAVKQTLAKQLTPAQRKRLEYATVIVLAPTAGGWGGIVSRDERKLTVHYCSQRGLVAHPIIGSK